MERLRTFEAARRAETDFSAPPASDLGPDPIAIARLPEPERLVGLLRGRSALVMLDGALRPIARIATPPLPSGLAVSPTGELFVASELSSEIARYAVRNDVLARTGTIPLDGARSVRAIAWGPEGVLYAVEDLDHRLLTLRLGATAGTILEEADEPIGLGPRLLLRTAHHLLVVCVLSHEVVVLPVDAQGVPRRTDAVRIRHDGPVWAVDAAETADGIIVALGGVEDHPLDRRQGSFGYIDSFAWIYRVTERGSAEQLAAVNVSALGVVTPKLVHVRLDGDDVRLRVTGYGAAPLAELTWAAPRPARRGSWPHPAVVTRSFVPGGVAEVALDDGRRVVADPLLDAWVVDDGTTARVVLVPDDRPARSVDARVGEALVFTTLIAPWNRTKGALSRFTCETCHFEGGVDGRIHDPGRGNLHVTTRPLFGLFNDRPYFSRALDPDLTTVAFNEFRVAGLRSRHDPWFAIGAAEAPWLAYLGVGSEPLGGEDLRRALLVFLMGFGHRPNPTSAGRTAWSAEEARGAAVFSERCEGCHEARLAADRPESRVPFAEWERLVMRRAAPIVWARDTYERTGIEPYPHERGTRVPSLRRLARKRPYFTNGSARDLGEVLGRVRIAGARFSHDGRAAGSDAALDAASQRALLAFLDLL